MQWEQSSSLLQPQKTVVGKSWRRGGGLHNAICSHHPKGSIFKPLSTFPHVQAHVPHWSGKDLCITTWGINIPVGTPFALGAVNGCPGPAAPPRTACIAVCLFFTEAYPVSLGSFKSVFSPDTELRPSPFLSQPDRHSYLASQTSPP